MAIHQPNYIPWLGYFRKVAQADVFVFFDNVQMPIGKSLVSRNRVRTPNGVQWLTVPTRRSSEGKPISETPIAEGNWAQKHLKTLRLAYSGSPWLDPVLGILDTAFSQERTKIADLNIAVIREIAAFIGIQNSDYLRATDLNLEKTGAATIVEILEATDATTYLTGTGAGSMRHLDVEFLASQGVETETLSTEFREYSQKFSPFEANLSVIDALLNVGPEETKALLE